MSLLAGSTLLFYVAVYFQLLPQLLQLKAWKGDIAKQPSLLIKDTLVIYVYAENDPECLGNLQYFVREAMQVRARLMALFWRKRFG